MNNHHTNQLWVEKYRPTHLQDIHSHSEIIQMLRQFMLHNQLPHLFFHGPAGIGKTSTVISLAKEIYKTQYCQMTLHINASDNTGSDFIKKEIVDFITTKGLFAILPYKIVILDEADSMSKEAQIMLKEIINEYGESVRFCLIGNYQHAIIPELSSHLIKMLFLPIPKEFSIQVGEHILQQEKIEYDTESLSHLYSIVGGDLRKYINMIQTIYLRHGKLQKDEVAQFLKQYEFGDIQLFLTILQQAPFSLQQAFSMLKEYLLLHSQSFTWWMSKATLFLLPHISPHQLSMFIQQASTIEYTCSFLVNYDIQMYAYLSLCHQVVVSLEK